MQNLIDRLEHQLEEMWNRQREFGMERGPHFVYQNHQVPDRRILTHGYQMLRDDLDFADDPLVRADFSTRSALVTLARTMCGDRINEGQPHRHYILNNANRFGDLTDVGHVKFEYFTPAGGGTDDGNTLAHVTVAHAIDPDIREEVLTGNPESIILYNFDLGTHVGKMDAEGITFGAAAESQYRQPRNACGAIVGALEHYDSNNLVHQRIRQDLGEENFQFLRESAITTEEGTDISYVVAAAIVAIQGMYNTINGLANEGISKREIGHLTASINVNMPSMDDTVIMLGRATLYDNQVTIQGLGTDAAQYGGRIIDHDGEKRLMLMYDGLSQDMYPAVRIPVQDLAQ